MNHRVCKYCGEEVWLIPDLNVWTHKSLSLQAACRNQQYPDYNFATPLAFGLFKPIQEKPK